MSAGHRAVIEAGPVTIRRLCCGGAEAAGAGAAVEWIDDPVGLVDGQPVAVPELLRDVLACAPPPVSRELIHPAWWPQRRVAALTAAAGGVPVRTRSRATVLAGAAGAAAVVEIAAGLVAVTGTGNPDMVAEPRIGAPGEVADAVARRVLAALGDRRDGVVIDAPAGVGGAPALARMIGQRLGTEVRVTVADGLPPVRPAAGTPVTAATVARRRRRRGPAAAALGLALPVGWALVVHPGAAPTPVPTSYLLDGAVAMQVPADWTVRRVSGGTGSARVEVANPADPHQVLHLTQMPVPAGALAAVAEALQQGLRRAQAETPGVFVDFDPAGTSAGRPAVTYREVRADRQIAWAVLVDGSIRIAIGCQSGPGGADTVRDVCEQAVASAHAAGR
ncbi:hypothetical protein AWC02_18035 [Mycolicibacter engbaekii]|uniref:Type VII secretion-associated protein n=1 Tax=Mycolicibacter engbaekii TaxID=188915 RepID=A0A1X1T9S8_9MYCO|nr:type VII secretion-associated protein [Mycolicibacter engbaekii]ORV41307.1 hypothetical protein AWC02_18035 [Mycolicibacter engbaekii]